MKCMLSAHSVSGLSRGAVFPQTGIIGGRLILPFLLLSFAVHCCINRRHLCDPEHANLSGKMTGERRLFLRFQFLG